MGVAMTSRGFAATHRRGGASWRGRISAGGLEERRCMFVLRPRSIPSLAKNRSEGFSSVD